MIIIDNGLNFWSNIYIVWDLSGVIAAFDNHSLIMDVICAARLQKKFAFKIHVERDSRPQASPRKRDQEGKHWIFWGQAKWDTTPHLCKPLLHLYIIW